MTRSKKMNSTPGTFGLGYAARSSSLRRSKTVLTLEASQEMASGSPAAASSMPERKMSPGRIALPGTAPRSRMLSRERVETKGLLLRAELRDVGGIGSRA